MSTDVERTYEYAGKTYRLVEHEGESWLVYDDDRYLGRVVAVPGEREAAPEYTPELAVEQTKTDDPVTGGWQLVLHYLIDNSAPPVGA